MDRDYAYNRRLFVRVAHGWYQFNPALALRRRNASGESWQPLFDALNLRFVAECADSHHRARINALLARAQQAPAPTLIADEAAARKPSAEREQEKAKVLGEKNPERD